MSTTKKPIYIIAAMWPWSTLSKNGVQFAKTEQSGSIGFCPVFDDYAKAEAFAMESGKQIITTFITEDASE